MEKQQFIQELKVYLPPKANSQDLDCSFYEKGFTSDDEEELILINDTNIKFYKTESNILMGDFFILMSRDASKHLTRFEVQYLYDSFLSGGWDAVEKIVEGNLNYLKDMLSTEFFELLKENNYEKLKDKMIIRPINYSDHKYEFKDAICRKIGDIMLVAYFVVKDQHVNETHNYASVKIPKPALQTWDINEDELWQYALTNTYALYPPRIYTNPLDLYHPPYTKGAFMAVDSIITHLDPHDVPALTTTSQMNGAVALFYPNVMKRISELFDDDFYAVFTSVHEVRLHKKDSVNPFQLLKRLKDINARFNPEEILSRKIYLYERQLDKLKQLEL